jgi:Protein of unknown function (DUF3592)
VFRELYNGASMMLSWGWPVAEGVITAVRVDPCRSGLQVVLDYEFSVNGQGPYTEASSAPSWFGATEVMDIQKTFRIGRALAIRYRRDDPSVNRIDWRRWQGLEDAL